MSDSVKVCAFVSLCKRVWRRHFLGLAAAGFCLLPNCPLSAEPYLAVEAGLKCALCHTNPTGGGKRSLFGMQYARTRLATRLLLQDEETRGWNGQINRYLGVGGDYRGSFRDVDAPGSGSVSDWSTTRGQAYLELEPLPGLVALYVDRQLAPGGSLNRENYVLVTPRQGRYSIKAGRFFLPFGWRLQDDSAFVRQRSGINFDTPDEGAEFGLELPKWSAQAAFSDGTAGAGHISGKSQTSLSAQHVRSRWRAGLSLNRSMDPLGDRSMAGLFAGWKTGPIAWLAELDFIMDEVPGRDDRRVYASLLEGNWRLHKGHNLKVTYEFVDPSDAVGNDQRERYSVVWEYSPIQLLQTRAGFRAYNGVPAEPLSNRDEIFVEFHVYF